MITVWLGVQARLFYRYCVAGHLLTVDRPVAALAPFTTKDEGAAIEQPPFVFEGATSTGRQVSGWVAGIWRDVFCEAAISGYRLTIAGIGAFAVRADGQAITFSAPEGRTADEEMVDQALLGPALTIALAARGTFCLHAGAVLAGDRAVAFLGDTGTGKSTLAAYLAGQIEGWQRIADDVLPVATGETGPVALPHFPQLKLPADMQAGPQMPEQVPLTAVYLLEVPSGPALPHSVPLDRRTAAAVLIRHTVANSLFDARLLEPHMTFCADTAAHVPVRRLIYPHTRQALPRIAALLTEEIASPER